MRTGVAVRGCSANIRGGDLSPGGASRQPIMTAYRQQALMCAGMLQAGPGRPRDLRVVVPEDRRIFLLRNVYGWFEYTQRGVYQLSSVGRAALPRWPRIMPPPTSKERPARGFSPPIWHGKLLGDRGRQMWDSTLWSKVWVFGPCVPIP